MNVNWQDVAAAAEHLTGFVIVMLALTVLWGLTALMGKIVARFDKTPAKPAAVPVPAASAPVAEAIDDDLVVVAAAAAAMLDARHRIVAVRPQVSSWGQQGRRDIHASHRIR
jgi:glutaconyl-CoA/methylmalonyl-CoA decarboxylase subunit delta